MYIKRFKDVEEVERQYGRSSKLLSKKVTENLDIGLYKVKKGVSTIPRIHENEEQAYIILSDKGRMRINNEEQDVEEGMVLYIPRKSEHNIKNTGKSELIYICVSDWPIT